MENENRDEFLNALFSSLLEEVNDRKQQTKLGLQAASKSIKDVYDSFIEVGFNEDQALSLTMQIVEKVMPSQK